MLGLFRFTRMCRCSCSSSSASRIHAALPARQFSKKAIRSTTSKQQKNNNDKRSNNPKNARSKGQSGGGRHQGRRQPSQPPVVPPPPRSITDAMPRPSKASLQTGIIPPALLLPTASEHVYVSKIAVESAGIDPRSLYTNVRSFQEEFPGGSFEAIPLSSSSSSSLSPSIPNCPSVAVLGRSNVGKSSLLNALMKKQLAVTSKQPGRTQHVFRYGFNSAAAAATTTSGQKQHYDTNKSRTGSTATAHSHPYLFCLVDLPGYGYAVGPEAAVDQWQKRSQQFLKNDPHLRRVYVLMDARHGATEMDMNILSWLDEAALPYTAVLTKADATDKASIIKWTNQLCMRYHHQFQVYMDNSEDDDDDDDDDDNSHGGRIYQSPMVHVTSSKKNWGLNELMSSITADMVALDDDDENDRIEE